MENRFTEVWFYEGPTARTYDAIHNIVVCVYVYKVCEYR